MFGHLLFFIDFYLFCLFGHLLFLIFYLLLLLLYFNLVFAMKIAIEVAIVVKINKQTKPLFHGLETSGNVEIEFILRPPCRLLVI